MGARPARECSRAAAEEQHLQQPQAAPARIGNSKHPHPTDSRNWGWDIAETMYATMYSSSTSVSAALKHALNFAKRLAKSRQIMQEIQSHSTRARQSRMQTTKTTQT